MISEGEPRERLLLPTRLYDRSVDMRTVVIAVLASIATIAAMRLARRGKNGGE